MAKSKRAFSSRPQARPPGFAVVVQQAFEALKKEDWEAVATLLNSAREQRDAPDITAVSSPQQLWWMVYAMYWRRQATLPQESEDDADEDLAYAMRDLAAGVVQAHYDALDASGASNPTPHELCRALLKDIAALTAMEAWEEVA